MKPDQESLKKIGLLESDWEELKNAFVDTKNLEKVVLFGSRAKGTFKAGSDVDLAIYGDDLTEEELSQLRQNLEEESLLPYYFDLIRYSSIENAALKEHIEEFGILLYNKATS